MAEFNISRFKYIWKGVWQSGKQFNKDDIVAVGGKAYVCLIGHIASVASFDDDLNAVDQFGNPQPYWELLADGTRWLGNWQANQKYNQNELVKDGATIYRCIIGHTSDALTINGLAADVEKWEFVARTVFWRGDWVGSRKYKVGDIVKYRGFTYVANAEHTSVETQLGIEPDIDNWDIFNQFDFWTETWGPGAKYSVNDIVSYGGIVYRCITAHTSSTQNLNVDSANWEIVITDIRYRNEWTANDLYLPNDIVRQGSTLYRASTSSQKTSFDSEDWTTFLPGAEFKNAWNPSVTYSIGDIVTYGGYSYINPISSSQNNNPSTDWLLLNTGFNFRDEFTYETEYLTGDVVRFGGSLYVAIGDSVGAFPAYEVEEFRYEVTVQEVTQGLIIANRFFIDGRPSPKLYFTVGSSYIFDQTDISNNTHPLYFSTQYDSNHETGNFNFSPAARYYIDDTEVTASDYIANFGIFLTNRYIVLTPHVSDVGELYLVCANHTGMYGSSDNFAQVVRANQWEKIVDGLAWKYSWNPDNFYYPGDVVVYRGSPFVCQQVHKGDESSLVRPDLDDGSYWKLLVLGSLTNRLNKPGDMKVGIVTDTIFQTEALDIGGPGQLLKSQSPIPEDGETIVPLDVLWRDFNVTPSVYYVAPGGIDREDAGNQGVPFASIKYACEFIAQDLEQRTPATIFVSTGSFSEELPIIVPKDVAIVGEELRSTSIKPAPGFETENMFLMHNGSGLRNLSVTGLQGTLGDPNAYFTRRPTAGAYVSLDPGEGPDDESVWITNKSPYVQNVTTFGTGCIGLKIDGTLHTGGNKSIVANDFTQILSDGIGVWVNGDARSELVSVFSYYGHIGYLATEGGTIRATNGNSSYGDYGCVAEGFLETEEVIEAQVNHRSQQAQIDTVYFVDGKIRAFDYTNTGQDYRNTADYNIVGSGAGENITIGDNRNNGVFEIRLLQADDSTDFNGAGFTLVTGFSASGNITSLTLQSSDENLDPARYIGQTIFINDGPGTGQYGIIDSYDVSSKIATITSPEGFPGWSTVIPGYPLQQTIGDSSSYSIEPTFVIDPPDYNVSNNSTGSFKQIVSGVIGPELSVVLPIGDTGAYSTDGGPWVNMSLPSSENWFYSDTDGVYIYALADNGKLARTLNGSNWTFYDLPQGATYSNIWTTQDLQIVLRSDSTQILKATDPQDAFSWSTINIPLSLGSGFNFITYQNGYIVIGNPEGEFFGSSDSTNWSAISNPTQIPGISNYIVTDVTAGNNVIMVAMKSTSGGNSIFAHAIMSNLDSETLTWYVSGNAQENSVITTSLDTWYLDYRGGLFFALSNTGSINTTQDCWNWTVQEKQPGNYVSVKSGQWDERQRFLLCTTNLSSSVNWINAGATARGRGRVIQQQIDRISISEPGSGYNLLAPPDVSLNDNGKITDITPQARVASGLLGQPSIINTGFEYIRASGSVQGDGFADIFPTKNILYVKNLTREPGPGDTLSINGYGENFFIQKIEELLEDEETGVFTAKLQVAPNIKVNASPAHEENITIRQRYSQVRLTGHDFLDIGTGNFGETAYPALYNFGYDFGENNPKPSQEVSFANGGRVFYTSTDQDGNFRVGELFKVEQSSGNVTISATQFNLDGLEELRLGGIVLGGSSAVIREFSTDPTFIANSDNIVPTQRAISSYISGRITSGGSNANVNTAIAGNIVITGNNITNRADNTIIIDSGINLKQGALGDYLALQLFTK